jgi:hypothetical protein
MADYNNNDDFNNLCVNDLCINEYEFENTAVIRPPEKKNVKLEQRFIFIDTSDLTNAGDITGTTTGAGGSHTDGRGTTFTVDFGETIKNVVEIELMSCQMPKTDVVTYPDNYILLFLDNLDLDNYKISTNNAVSHCFARLPIPGTAANVFFGRIKNFTNTYKFKPTLQSLNKLTIRITNKDGNSEVAKNFLQGGTSKGVQLTFAITYQTHPHLFEN